METTAVTVPAEPAAPRRGLDWLMVGGGIVLAGAGVVLWSALIDASPRSSRPALPTTKSAFVSLMLPAVQSLGLPAVAVPLVVAHAAYESAWGRTTAFRDANNPWNVTAGSSWLGATVPGGDSQCDPSGNCQPITQQWRSYPDLAWAARDYLSLLQATAPAAVSALDAGDSTWVHQLRSKAEGGSGYYTQPAAQYLANYQSVLASVQGLV